MSSANTLNLHALRSKVSKLVRGYPWLPGTATLVSAAVFILALVRSWPLLEALGAVFLVLTSFVWGYAAHAIKRMDWPVLRHLQRRQYAEVWDALATSPRAARAAACGQQTEGPLRRSAATVHDRLAELADIHQQDDILEIGCGVGRIGFGLAPHCHSWTGADISPNMLEVAADRLRGFPNVRLVLLHEIGLVDLAADSFDLVYCTNVFAHLDEMDRWRYVQEGFRVLRPSGRLCVDNLDLECDACWQIFAQGATVVQQLERPPYQPRPSTAVELATYARRAGFVQVRAYSRPPLVVVTALKAAVTA